MQKPMTISLLVYIFLLLVLASSSLGTMSNSRNHISLLNFTTNSASHPSQALVRARHLNQHMSSFSFNIPIIPHQNGALIPLRFGTPSQILYFIFDTASSLTWLPCNHKFTQDIQTKKLFNPTISSSSKFLECNHPKSRWFDDRKLHYQCENPKAHRPENCSKHLHYKLRYAVGVVSGILLRESLYIPGHTVEDFIVGCSNTSSEQYEHNGFVGFGRNAESFPSQLGIKRFSYCLPSSHFIGKSQTRYNYLTLNDGSHSGNISYTPFHKNSSARWVSDAFYYVILEGIIIGNKTVTIPRRFLVPKTNGEGGTIVDSASTFTVLHISIFMEVAKEFRKQLGKGRLYTGTRLVRFCFEFSVKEVRALPGLKFQFKDGALMIIPWQNYLTGIDDGLNCLSIVSPTFPVMQSILLGNTMMRDFYVEFDLEKERFGFDLSKKCT